MVDKDAGSGDSANWTFLSNHAHVLLVIAKDPEVTLREVAVRVGITERAVQRIVADLEGKAYLTRYKVGRRNQYQVRTDLPLRHPIEAHTDIGSLLNVILGSKLPASPKRSRKP